MLEQLFEIPVWYVLFVVFIFGSIIGSFLDVLTLRFHTGQSINGRSHCLSCGETLAWYELLPIVSYLVLRGRCKACHAAIPLRLLLVELSVGALFVWSYLVADTVLEFAVFAVLVCLLTVVAIYDQRHMIIPNVLTVLLGVLALVYLYTSFSSFAVALWLPYLLSGLSAFSFFAGLWLVSRGRWIGFGDAKLAAPLGLMLGPMPTFSFIIFSFWIGALVSVSLLGVSKLLSGGKDSLPFTTGTYTMKTEVPFAPFMIAAFLLVLYTGADVMALMTSWFYGS